MKKNAFSLLMSAAVLACFVVPAHGQGLGDAAKREADRRAKLAKEAKDKDVKVYTNADLKDPSIQRPIADAQAAKPAAQPDAAAAAPAEKPAEETAAKPAGDEKPAPHPQAVVRQKRDEEHWRERAKVIRDRLIGLRTNAAALEGRVASLQLELQSATPDTAPGLGKELDSTNQALARFNREIRLIEDEWTKFEDRARAAKVPPSWIY